MGVHRRDWRGRREGQRWYNYILSLKKTAKETNPRNTNNWYLRKIKKITSIFEATNKISNIIQRIMSNIKITKYVLSSREENSFSHKPYSFLTSNIME